MSKNLQFGIQECAKCQYKLRCEECVYNEKDISELIKFEKEQTRKETAKEILDKIIWFAVKRIGQTSGDSYYQISFDRLSELAKQYGVEIKE